MKIFKVGRSKSTGGLLDGLKDTEEMMRMKLNHCTMLKFLNRFSAHEQKFSKIVGKYFRGK